MVTSELRRVRYPFAGRAAAPRVVEPLFLYTPVRCRGFLCLGRGVPYIRFVVVLCVRKCGGKGRQTTLSGHLGCLEHQDKLRSGSGAAVAPATGVTGSFVSFILMLGA